MKATQNPPTAVQVTPADLLRMAALYLRRHGWHQGTYYHLTTDTPTPPACAAGAIGIATAGHRVEHFSQLAPDALGDYLAALAAFVDYLDTTEPLFLVDDDGFVIDEHTSPYSWNDDPARTAEQVITALETAADEWDRLHTTGGENR
ncbi:hypothetical protein [Verrucosispora sp. WMMD1129]|uniref:DUF6197 family protein n=1 Tax=Verrucosispora sp. WMMD1129 TaxID=3016093 RepID=UPI00249A4719|nr:hypothetical protein [Verrucosispora sp. WMMD1129]WFE46360.1 hypothetical protein O7624_19395 [Verrucosispora sp. WMMD1129]WFE47080.1 hypothetical protein O7624_23485 [Verrucosispora sp. WMMD1129]